MPFDGMLWFNYPLTVQEIQGLSLSDSNLKSSEGQLRRKGGDPPVRTLKDC